jgi:hypothetical protein
MAYFSLFFDESGKSHTHPVTSLTGVCTPDSRIHEFDEAWGALLREHGLKVFHMVEAIRPGKAFGKIPEQTLAERIEALKPFADCINKHLEVGIMMAWDVGGFAELSTTTPMGPLGSPTSPYFLCFARGFLEIVDDHLSHEDRLSVICDDDQETAWVCYAHYRAIRNAWKNARKRAISISFANDFYYPALQAADLVALLVRREANHLFYGEPFEEGELFDYLRADRVPPTMLRKKMFADKQKSLDLAESMRALQK